MNDPTDIPSKLSDRSLLRRLRGGSQDAATVLYFRYARRLRALVRAQCSTALSRRVEPDDIVQSVFHRFFRRVCQGHYDVPPGEELWGLFLVMALNKIRSAETFHRANKRSLYLTQPMPADLPDTTAHQDDASYALLQTTLTEVLEQLPDRQRQMVELRIQGHGIDEIAQQTGRSKRTVERNLQEIRRHLRTVLSPDNDPAIPV